MKLVTLHGRPDTVHCFTRLSRRLSALVGAGLLFFGVAASTAHAQTTPTVLSAPSPVCQGQTTVTYSINAVPAGQVVVWVFQKDPNGLPPNAGSITTAGAADSTAPSGSLFSKVSGANLHSITITFTDPDATDRSRDLQVYTVVGMMASTIVTTSIDINNVPAAPGAIDGNSFTQCSGATGVDFDNAGADANLFTITVPTPGDFTTQPVITDAAAGELSVGVAPLGGTFTLNSFNTNGPCTSPATSQVITVARQSAPGAITAVTGNFTRCQGETSVGFTSTDANGWTMTPTGFSTAPTLNVATGVLNTVGVPTGATGTITLNAFVVTGACSSLASTQAITVVRTPTTPGAITATGGASPRCANETITYTTAAPAATAWDISPAPTGFSTIPTVNATTGEVNTGVPSGASATFTLRAFQVVSGCSSAAVSSVITVNAPAADPVSFSAAPLAICQGAATTYTVTAVAGATGYQWTLPAGWTGTSTTNSIVATPNGTSGAITVVALNGTCPSVTPLSTGTITVTPNPAAPTAVGPTVVQCQGSTVNYTATAGGTLAWAVTGTGWSINATTGEATVGSANGTISVYNVVSGCSSAATVLNVTVRPTPTAPTGPATVCAGAANVNFSVATNPNDASYIWTLPAGLSISGSATGSTIAVFAAAGAAAASGNITVQAVTTAGCTTLVSPPRAVSIIPRPAAPTGPTSICAGTAGHVFTTPAVAGATSYTWTLPANYTITAGTTTNTITVSLGASAASGNITVRANTADCNTAQSDPLAITVPNPAAPTAVGPTVVQCQGATVNYTATAGGTLAWAVTGAGWSINPTTGEATVGSANGTISVYNVVATCSSAATVLNVTVRPTPTAPTGPATVCAGAANVNFSVATNPNDVSYIWTLPAGLSISGGATGSTIAVFAPAGAAPASGNITVQAVTTAGCTTLVSPPRAVSIIPRPAAPTGPTSICAGTTGHMFTTPAVAGATSYTWTLPANYTITAGTTTNTITVSLGASAVSGNITVRANTADCNTAQSDPLAITVLATPTAPTGPTEVCAGVAGYVYSVTAVPGATSYIWTVPGGLTINGPATGTSITVDAPVGIAAGASNITVAAVSASCTTSASAVLAVTRRPRPAAPTLALAGAICDGSSRTINVAAVAGATGYVWTLPSGWTGTSTTNSITATIPLGASGGNVTVQAVFPTCTTAASLPLALTVNATPAPVGAIVATAGTTTYCGDLSVFTFSSTGANDWFISTPAPTGFGGGGTAPSITAGGTTATVSINVGRPIYPNVGSFTISARNTNGTCSTAVETMVITVNPVPPLPSAITGITGFCANGSNARAYATGAAAGDLFTWTIPPGTGSIEGAGDTYSAVGDNSVDIVWNALPPVNNDTTFPVSVRRTLAGCAGPIQTNNAVVWRQPTTTIVGATTAAALSLQAYSVTRVVQTNYTWSFQVANPNVSFVSPTNTNQVQVAVGELATGSFTLRVVETNQANPACSATRDIVVTINACPNTTSPVTVVTGSICQGEPGIFQLSGGFTGTLNWQYSADAGMTYFPVPGGITNSPVLITSTALPVGNYLIRAQATQGACPPFNSTGVPLVISVPPTVGFVTPAAFANCFNQTNVLTASPAGTTSITWQINSSPTDPLAGVWSNLGTSLPGVGSFAAPAFLPADPRIGQRAFYRAVVTGGCGVAVSNTVTVNVQPLPAGTIAYEVGTPTTLCVGDVIQLRGTLGTNMVGTWTVISPTGNSGFTSVAFPSNPQSDPDAQYVVGPGDGGDRMRFFWTISSGNCTPLTLGLPQRFGSPQPAGTWTTPAGALSASVCAGSLTRPIETTATTGTGQGTFQVFSLVPFNAPLQPGTQLYNSTRLGGGVYSTNNNSSPYVATPSLGDTVQLQIDPNETPKVIVVRWVVDNAFCAPEIIDGDTLAVTANTVTGTFAGATLPATGCPTEPTPPLGATLGSTGEIGIWEDTYLGTTTPAAGTFSLNSNPNATYTPSPLDAAFPGVTLRWRVTNPACSGNESIAERSFVVQPQPQGQLLGATDQITVCVDSITPNQSADTQVGAGSWVATANLPANTYVGTGTFRNPISNLIEPTNPNAYYRPAPGDGNQTFRVTWRVITPYCVNADDNSRVIRVNATASSAVATTDTFLVCAGNFSPSLGGQLFNGSTGEWVVDTTTGRGSIQGGTSNGNARYVALDADTNRTVRIWWIARNGVCTPDTSIRYVRVPRASFGRLDTIPAISVCEGQTTPPLAARAIYGIGRWRTSDGGTFSNIFNPNATYTTGINDAAGQAFRTFDLFWDVQNDTCDVATYRRQITVFSKPQGSVSPFLVNYVCLGSSFALSTLTSAGSTSLWRLVNPADGTITNATTGAAQYTPSASAANTTVSLTWTLRSPSGCDSTVFTRQVRVFEVLATATSNTPEICLAGGISQALLTAGGGVSPGASYQWTPFSGPGPATLLNQNSQVATFLRPSVPGIYTFSVLVRDTARGVCSDTALVSVAVQSGGSVQIDSVGAGNNNTVCTGVPFRLSSRLLGSTMAQAYVWRLISGSGSVRSDSTRDTIQAVVNGSSATFQVLVTTFPSGCEISATRVISTYNVITPRLVAQSTCPDEQKRPIVANDVLGCERLIWYRGLPGSLPDSTLRDTVANAAFRLLTVLPAANNLTQSLLNADFAGTDPLTGKLTLGRKDFCVICFYPQDCNSRASTSFAVLPNPTASFYAAPDISRSDTSSRPEGIKVPFFTSRVHFTANQPTLDSLPPLVPRRRLEVFLWDFGAADQASVDNPNTAVTDTANFTYRREGVYTVTLFVADTLGCSDVTPRPNFVTVQSPDFFFPSAFSPDGIKLSSTRPGISDEINERFRPLPENLDSTQFNLIRFEVYDSRGALVFQTRNVVGPRGGWDGNMPNGEPAEVGTYTYIVEVEFKGQKTQDNVRRRYADTVRLLR